MFDLVPLIVLFPLLGLLINACFGRQFRDPGAGIVASVAAGLSFVVAVLQFAALLGHPAGAVVPLAEWIHIGGGDVAPPLHIPWAFQVDTLSVTMMLVVTGVGTLIHIYAIGYMHGDERFPRFFVYLNLFLASMLVLITGNNYLMLFVGWELVGLCSYLLIGFWFDKGENGTGNARAGRKAFVVNRIGDLGMLLALFLIFWTFGSLTFGEVFEKAEHILAVGAPIATLITLLLLVGAAGKSAQIPLYVWLPDAMAGPTPVSALIHAATMVTAGIYMIARSHVLFALAPTSQLTVALIGGATALLAATIAVGQFDIKRVLAYSTISQLGFMVAAVGLGAYVAGLFHLATHAFFKALLFLAAGSVIHGVEHGAHEMHDHVDAQDMRVMGGLRSKMPTTFAVYLVGALALAGIPPLAGFFSKDEILADASQHNPAVYSLLTLAAVFTAFYMGRQILMVFFGEARSKAAGHAVESKPAMTVPLIILAGLAVFGGAMNLPGVHSLTHWLGHTLGEVEAGGFNLLVAGVSTVLALVAIALAYAVYGRKPMEAGDADPLARMLGPLFVAVHRQWWVDELYYLSIIRPYNALSAFLAEAVDWTFWHDFFHDRILASGFRGLARLLAEPIDLGVIDWIANRLADVTKGLAARLRTVQTGYVRNYALSVLFGAVAILGYFLIRR